MSFFHPSQFETSSSHTPRDDRITRIKIEGDVAQMKSPGKYNLTIDDNKISGSNTRHLFKNLWGETPLTFLFFSRTNIENIQDLIKMVIHKNTGYIVDNQSLNELMIVMRSIFLQYAAHPKLFDVKMSDTELKELRIKYTNEVARLNDIVINAIVPNVVSQMQQYIDYLRDASTQPYQSTTPQNSSVAGQREYRSITQVLLGSEL